MSGLFNVAAVPLEGAGVEAAAPAPAAPAAAPGTEAPKQKRGRKKQATGAAPPATAAPGAGPTAESPEQQAERKELEEQLMMAQMHCPEYLPVGFELAPGVLSIEEMRDMVRVLELKMASSNTVNMFTNIHRAACGVMEETAKRVPAVRRWMNLHGFKDEVDERRPDFEQHMKHLLVCHPWLSLMGPLMALAAETADAAVEVIQENAREDSNPAKLENEMQRAEEAQRNDEAEVVDVMN